MNLGQLADALGLPVHGDATFQVNALASLERAGPADLSFIVDRRFSDQLKHCNAGALIVPSTFPVQALPTNNYLTSDNPYASFARASWLLKPVEDIVPGVHPTAVIDTTATVSDQACIGPQVVIGAYSTVSAGVKIDAHCVVGRHVIVGEQTRLFARVCVYDNVSMGHGCRVQAGAVLGSEGFGYARTGDGWIQIQQTGGLRIGARVHIGAGTTIDCGALDSTLISDDVIIDNQVQIAHNVQIGENTAIAGCTGIAGSTQIGKNCLIGGACNIVGHLRIADGVVLNAASLVTRSIESAGRYGSGTPLLPEHAWRRSFVNLGRLDSLINRIKHVERSLDRK